LGSSNTALKTFIHEAAEEYALEHNFDIKMKEENLSLLIEKVSWLRNKRIPNI